MGVQRGTGSRLFASKSFRRRSLVVALTVCVFLFVTAAAAFAQFQPGPFTFTPGTEDCNGIIPTPGSENTVKTVVGGQLIPGGTATYNIHFPEDPANVGDFQIRDCVLIGTGSDLKSYAVLDNGTFSFVNNSQDFNFQFTFNIPPDAVIGTRICNVAKTVQSPSKSPASNRKAGPACFTVGGDVRIEKHSAANPNGPVIQSPTTFSIWGCVNSADDPTLQPIIVTPSPTSGSLTAGSAANGAHVTTVGPLWTIAVSGPSGSTCNVTEITPPAGFQLPGTVTQSFTIPIGTAGPTVISFVDPLAPGSITINKTAPAGAGSTVFHFTITCTDPANVYHVQVTGSGSVTQNDVPAGSSCTVTEDDPGSTFNPPVISPSGAFTVTSGQTVTVTVTNSFAPGSITIEKTAPASQQSTVFHFTITCTNPSNVYHVQVTGSGSVTQQNVPAGSSCTVTEDDPGSTFNPPTIDPSGAFTVGASQNVTVTVTNTLAPGSITIEKTAPVASQSVVFHFTITCTGPSNVYHVQVTGSNSVTQGGIPAGSSCTVTEDDPGASFNPPVIDPSGAFTVGANQNVTVTVLNTLAPGSITIEKTAPASEQNTVFNFTITCTNPSNVYHVSITGTGSVTQHNVPAGSSCTVTEDDPGPTFETPVISPSGAFTVGAAGTVTVTVTNSLKPGAITIEKTAPASEQSTVFHFTITCTNPTNVYHVQVTGSDSVTQSGIPAESSCTVTEDDPGSTFEPAIISPSGAFTVHATETVTVTVTNTLKPGAVTITKVAPAEEQNTVFHFSLDCTNPTQHYDLQVTGSNSVTQDNIPAGSSCTVTETNLPDVNNAPTIDPAGEFTVGATQTVTVTVTNTLKPLGILIEKSVTPTSGNPGDTVTYTYKVTNTGEVTLFNVLVTDDKLGTIGTIDTLAVGEVKILTKTTTLPNNAGALTNVATASGTDVLGRRATDTDTAVVTVVLALPPLVRTGTNDTGIGLVGILFVAVGITLATRKERGRVRLAFAASGSVAGREVMLAAHRRSWRMRRRRGPATRAHLRWRRSQGPPMRDGP